jgi:hypothetical protein
MLREPDYDGYLIGRAQDFPPKVSRPHTSRSVDDLLDKRPVRSLPEGFLAAVEGYVGNESRQRPYNDNDILEEMRDLGYLGVTRADIKYARRELGIESARHRYR